MNEIKFKNYELAEADYVAGMKYKDIAKKYKVTMSTVKSWKFRYNWHREKVCKKSIQKKVCKGVKEDMEKTIENTEINDQRKLFCLYYVRCFNATKAYSKAFPNASYTTCMVNGCKLLKEPAIKREIDELKQNKFSRELINADDIFQKYIDIAFADIGDYIEFGRGTVNVITRKGDIAEVTDNYVLFKDQNMVDTSVLAEVSQGKTGIRIKLLDKMKALDWLSKQIGIMTEEEQIKIKSLESKIDLEKEKLKLMEQEYENKNWL